MFKKTSFAGLMLVNLVDMKQTSKNYKIIKSLLSILMNLWQVPAGQLVEDR